MKRQEAIEELSILLNKYQDGHFGDALDMAIKALERQKDINIKCEQCPFGEIEVRNICNYDGHGCGMD